MCCKTATPTRKALQFAKELEVKHFTASGGWLDRFNKRDIAVYKVMCSEKRSFDPESLAKRKSETLPDFLKGHSHSTILNADEPGRFLKFTAG